MPKLFHLKKIWFFLVIVVVVVTPVTYYFFPTNQISFAYFPTFANLAAYYYHTPQRDYLTKNLIILGHNKTLCRLASAALGSASPHPVTDLSRFLSKNVSAGTLFSKCGEIESDLAPLEPHSNDTLCVIAHDDSFAYQSNDSKLGLAEYLERVDGLCQNLPKIILDITKSLNPDELTSLSEHFKTTLLSQMAQFETHSRTNSTDLELPNDLSLSEQDIAVLESIQEKPYTFWRDIPSHLVCLDRQLLREGYFPKDVRMLDYDRKLCPATFANMKSDNRKSQEKRKFFFVFTTTKESKISLTDFLNLGIKSVSGEWKPRTSRSIESALFNYPNADVRVYSNTLETNQFATFVRLGYQVQVVRYNLDVSFFKGSPLERWAEALAAHHWQQTDNFYSNISNALRIFLVWKYGGTYLDTDMILIKTLRELENTAGKVNGLEHLPQLILDLLYYLHVSHLTSFHKVVEHHHVWGETIKYQHFFVTFVVVV
eukprot:TRINITY_DN2519_c0_g1_i1.p1 TRINITY_DN2519_c0_g1~~TRINITY_DN2519_c0_g1_i1.p1  ORF type:complete len:514 (+),score=146.77 TRINITY_DN2519_c0_g1_i1:90-1544(+)